MRVSFHKYNPLIRPLSNINITLYCFFAGVAPTILHLLQCAIVSNAANTTKKTEPTTKSSTSRKEREKSDDSVTESFFDETNCVTLVEQINQQIPKEVFAGFIKTFLLETNATSVRLQAHTLVYAIYK